MTKLTGCFDLDLSPERAFALFTPLGERGWVPGWDPQFPAPAHDDSAPGTVFQTDAQGRRATWIVVDRTPPTRISYARVIEGLNAGTVSVALDRAGGGSIVEVTYDVTPLTDEGERHLRTFADDYPDFLASWRTAIADRA